MAGQGRRFKDAEGHERPSLERFLSGADKTFRWNDGETFEGYEAVEVTEAGLRWFRWSHRGEDGGPSEEATQGFEEFERDGPLREMPPEKLEALRAHVAKARRSE